MYPRVLPGITLAPGGRLDPSTRASRRATRPGTDASDPERPAPGSAPMNDVTRILSAIEAGDPQAAQQLLPLVYDELRRLAACQLAQEKPGQTLQATALVHEAYLRLVGPGDARNWDSRAHFFA